MNEHEAMDNCRNCGAPVTDAICPYCGSPTEQMCTVGPGKIVHISWVDDSGHEIYFDMCVENLSIDQRDEVTDLRNFDGSIVKTVVNPVTTYINLGGHAAMRGDGSVMTVRGAQ